MTRTYPSARHHEPPNSTLSMMKEKATVTEVTTARFHPEGDTSKLSIPPAKAQITRVKSGPRPSPTLGTEPSEEMHPMPYRDTTLTAAGVAAIHLRDQRLRVPDGLAADIARQLERDPGSTRAVVLTLSDDACILIGPDDPLVIFVPRTTIGVDA